MYHVLCNDVNGVTSTGISITFGGYNIDVNGILFHAKLKTMFFFKVHNSTIYKATRIEIMSI